MIIGAISFHALPASLLFRPMSSYKTPAVAKGNGHSAGAAKNNEERDGGSGGLPEVRVTDESEAASAEGDVMAFQPLLVRSNSGALLESAAYQSGSGKLHKSQGSLQAAYPYLSKSKGSLHASVHSLAAFQQPADGQISGKPEVESNAQEKKGGFKLFDFSLFKNALFVIYVIGLSCGHAGYVNLCMFLPSYATETGVNKEGAAILLSLIGFSDLFGRVLGGWFADLGLLKRSNIMAICLTVTGETLRHSY